MLGEQMFKVEDGDTKKEMQKEIETKEKQRTQHSMSGKTLQRSSPRG
jgi:hypothetical protein